MLTLVNGDHFFFFFVHHHLNGSHVYATVRYMDLCKHFIAIGIGHRCIYIIYILYTYIIIM